MPGDEWQQFANLRLLYTYMFTYPGKKLLFMGCEFGQGPEWQHDGVLDWYTLQYPLHHGLQRLVGELNHLYRSLPALHYFDFDPQGYEWIDCHDAAQSILSYMRKRGDDVALVLLNFTPIPRRKYRFGVPKPGFYKEVMNSDAEVFGGSNIGNMGGVYAEPIPWMGRPYSIELTLPPLAGLVLQPV
jgi:1,4-alpha-glucan branching enzyme